MTGTKKLMIASIMLAAFCMGSNAYAFDESFHPNHKFVDRESIGPNLRSDLTIDQEKAAKVKTAEENMRLPSGVNPNNPSGANPNIITGPDSNKYLTGPDSNKYMKEPSSNKY